MPVTPSPLAKQLGAKSLKQVAEAWGTTTQALHYQFKENPEKFEIIVKGVVGCNMDIDSVKKWIRDNFGQETEKQCADSMRNADAGKYFDLVTDWNSLSEEEKKEQFNRERG